jgi:dTMP kinase
MPATPAPRDIPGKLIAVEGLDGSGKSTQVYLIKRGLELEGYKVFYTEWNSSAIVRDATRKGKKRNLLTPTTFSLIHCTDFADRYERNILPMLKAGFIVLADRYKFTALARDGVRGCPEPWVESLYSFAVQPDLTFYFRLPLAVPWAGSWRAGPSSSTTRRGWISICRRTSSRASGSSRGGSTRLTKSLRGSTFSPRSTRTVRSK